MNNTHVYDLRKAPPGYSGKTSLHDGTRLIQINNSGDKPAHKYNNNGTKGGGNITAQPDSRKRSARSEESRAKNSQPRHNAPPYAAEIPTRSENRRSSTVFSDEHVHTNDNKRTDRPKHDVIPGAGKAAKSSNSKSSTGNNRKKEKKSRVLHKESSDGVNNIGGSEIKKVVQNNGRQQKNSVAEYSINSKRHTQYESRNAPTDRYPVKESDRDRQTNTHNNENRDSGRQHGYPQPGDKYTVTGNIQNTRSMRTSSYSYDTSRPSDRERPQREIRTPPADQKAAQAASSGIIQTEHVSRTPPENNRRSNYNKSQQLRENSRYNADRPNPYNSNPVYSYGSRSSENPPENHRRSSQRPSRQEHKPEKPKMTAEERRMIAAAEEARKKAESQLKLEEAERKKANNKRRRAEMRKRRKASLKELRAELFSMLLDSVPLFIMFLIATVLIGGIAVLSFTVALRVNFSVGPDTVIYQIGEDKERGTETLRLSANKYIRGGVLYMSMDDFAERFEFTTVGTPDELKYISRVSDNIMKVKIGSSFVTVNDIPLRLSDPVIRDGKEVLVPYDFFASYVSGFSISYDGEKAKIKLLRDIADYTVSVGEGKLPVYANIGFIPSGYTETPNIIENSLPASVYAATDPNPPPPEPEPAAANTAQ